MPIRNKSKFCKEIGISRQTFYKYEKEGMPLDSEDAACEWIATHYGSGGGKNLKTHIEKKARNFDAENMPGVVVSAADVGRDDVLGVLARQHENEKVAWKILQDAQCCVENMFVSACLMDELRLAVESENAGGILKAARLVVENARNEAPLVKISGATRHYNACSDAYLKAESALVLMQNEEKALEAKAEQLAMDIIYKVLRPLRQMLRSLPARLAPRCNPAAVELARDVLDEEVHRLFEGTYLGKEKD